MLNSQFHPCLTAFKPPILSHYLSRHLNSILRVPFFSLDLYEIIYSNFSIPSNGFFFFFVTFSKFLFFFIFLSFCRFHSTNLFYQIECVTHINRYVCLFVCFGIRFGRLFVNATGNFVLRSRPRFLLRLTQVAMSPGPF